MIRITPVNGCAAAPCWQPLPPPRGRPQGATAVLLEPCVIWLRPAPLSYSNISQTASAQGELAQAPCLVFNTKDALQATWARRLCHRHVELPRHLLPSSQAFVTAAVAGMGWGLHPHALIAQHLEDGSLVELVPDTPLDVPLYWQHARAASALLDELSRQVLTAARAALLAP